MKKLLLALLLSAGVMSLAQAQNVTVYGIADAGVRYDGSANAAGADRTKFVSGAQSTSRIGFKGTEDLGGGLKANFNLENGFSFADGTGSQNGSTGTVLFDRLAWVGLSHNTLGEVQLGRNTNVTFDFAAAGITDPLAQALDGVSTPVGVNTNSTALRINQAVTLVGSTNGLKNTRSDSMIKYTNTIAGATVVAGYAPGGTAGDNQAKSNYNLGVKYTAFGVTGAASTLRAADATNKDLTVNSIGATAPIGPVQLTVGYHTAKTDVGYAPANLTTTATATTLLGGVSGVDAKLTTVGAKYQVTPALASTVAYYRGKYTNSATSQEGVLKSYVLFNQYNLSKRTNLYAELDYTQANGDLATGVSANNFGGTVGVRHSF